MDGIACESLPSTGSGGGGTTGDGSSTAGTIASSTVLASATTEEDLDCADLATQAQAQAELDADPSDPHNLDADDEVACEDSFGATTTAEGTTQRTGRKLTAGKTQVRGLGM